MIDNEPKPVHGIVCPKGEKGDEGSSGEPYVFNENHYGKNYYNARSLRNERRINSKEKKSPWGKKYFKRGNSVNN